jgi:hypothetical protein
MVTVGIDGDIWAFATIIFAVQTVIRIRSLRDKQCTCTVYYEDAVYMPHRKVI